MGRPWSSDLQTIHQAYKRRDTLDIYLADNTVLRLSRGAVTRVIGGTPVVYDNWIRSVDDLEYSLEEAIDRISVKCQNINSELGFKLASDLRLLDYALADYGKIYQSNRNPALIEDIPQVFRGVLANAEVDELNFDVELIVDYESLGAIIASRGLSPGCWTTYKNGIECTSTSIKTSCPKTRTGCAKRHDSTIKEAEFLGWEFFEEPTASAPGSGGNDGGIGGTCFTLETKIWTPQGEISIGELPLGAQRERIQVVSFNEITGEINYSDEIQEVFEHEVNGHFTFEFEHGSVNVTPEHRFFTALNNFLPADQFRIGDTTKTYIEDWFDSKLVRIKWNSDVKTLVRNLHVKKNHTYFVANKYAVHNAKNNGGGILI